MDRTHDVLVWGATGFTGKLLAEYLAGKKTTTRWAIGGRDRKKLEAVRADLTRIDPRLDALPIVVADAASDSEMAGVARATRVVATTVGPFARYGRPLARACASEGTHYADITGETTFMRASIDENDARARESGAKIVHACGFDSIPSDLGVLLLAEEAKKRDHTLAWVKAYVHRMKGGFSGGTLLSIMTLVEATRDPAVRKLVGDPYALDPAGPSNRRGERGPDGGDLTSVRFDRDIGWTAPFVMAGTNTRVVRRSNALLGHAYGPTFRYQEVLGFPAGPAGLAYAAATTLGMALFGGALLVAPLRKLLADHVLPAPGQGPSKAERERGFFDVRFVAETSSKGGPGVRLSARIAAKGDPGYQATSVMLGESALALAEDGPRLPGRTGVLTPATAIGMPLVERLRAAGFTLEASAT